MSLTTRSLMTKRQAKEGASQSNVTPTKRDPMLGDTDINNILLGGANIALTKMKRSRSDEDRLYYYAHISAFLEVSLSRGAGITNETKDDLNQIHQKATHLFMDARRSK